MSIERIALGTAQFGMDYGINNKRGKVPTAEVLAILSDAVNMGIKMFDTASVYGEAEEIIGNFLKQSLQEIEVISKLPGCAFDKVPEMVDASLEKINIKQLYGFMVHDFKSYVKAPQILDVLKTLKLAGKIKKIGFSLYYPKELDYLMEKKIRFDLIQVPYSIFDQRFSVYFSRLNQLGVEFHVRSIFLQGLVFKKQLDSVVFSNDFKNKLRQLNLLSQENKIPVSALCLNFVLLNKLVNMVVVGVDSLDNFKSIVRDIEYQLKIKNLMPVLLNLREDDEKIIVPVNWAVDKFLHE